LTASEINIPIIETCANRCVLLMPYSRRSGHCTRCEKRFDPAAKAFMVRENVVTARFPDGARTIVAVCKKCLTDDELKELRRLLRASPDKTRRRHIDDLRWLRAADCDGGQAPQGPAMADPRIF
jgi:hypothetical protein